MNQKEEKRVLVVDDEADIRELLSMSLRRMKLPHVCAADLGEARKRLAEGNISLCLTDMRLPDGDGIELVREIQALEKALPVAVITAHGNMETAVEALKAGAFDFVSKPIKLPALQAMVRSALALPELSAGEATKQSAPGGLQMIGDSPAVRETRKLIAKLARSQAPVYISGESGTGKELAARLIHAQSPRAEKPFVPVNCGAIPGELMESEFFGHRRGSFTGAQADKMGLFQAANGGTLFLDEVGDLPLGMQVKLLRAIQEKAVRSIGDAKETPVDVRVLSATHQDLSHAVDEGLFRRDLYYRINVIELPMPSLRERSGDLELLARHFLDKLVETGVGRPEVSDEAWSALKQYRFPGNVRELENVLERACTLCEQKRITVDDLRLPISGGGSASDAKNVDLGGLDLPEYLEKIERTAISQALEKTRFNKTAAAKRLGITFRALRYRLQKLGLDDDAE